MRFAWSNRNDAGVRHCGARDFGYGNVTDDVWKKYIEHQQPEMSDDSLKVVWGSRLRGRVSPA